MQVIASWPAQQQLGEVAGWAARAEDLGFDVIHVPETIHDPFSVAALALSSTSRIVVRTSMVVAFARSPMLTAYAAWDLVRLSRGRFELGIASQVRGNIVGRYSAEWSEPVARLGDYVRALQAIFAAFQTGAPLDYQGPHYAFTRLQPYFNPGPLDHPAPPIWTGGVNQRMCELAGELSDGFVCHPTSSHPVMLRTSILPAIEAGRENGGREGPGPAVVAGPQPIMAASQEGLGAVRDARRSELAFLYSTPAYRGQLELFGLGDLGEALSDMARREDWGDLSAHLPDDLVRQLVPEGTYRDLSGTLTDWYAGQCDGLVLTIPDDAETNDFRELVQRCRAIPTRG